jgi:acetyl-CoA carboxylase carboxyltransferase component
VILGRLQVEAGAPPQDVALRFSNTPGTGVGLRVTDRPTEPMRPLDDYTQKVLRSRARGLAYPYELAPLVAGPGGTFVEHDFDADGRLAPVDRPPGTNKAGIVVGLVTTPTPRYPEGMTRVALFGDPTKALGTVAVPECALLVAALDLAEDRGLPVEWFALSSGAKISMDSGTENMDAVAKGLRRIIEFTQAGGEINVVVAGINVGAQPYWNAEATMLMHTKGILVMTPDSAMVLTGKHSLDYSGGVSAEDNFGLGGYDRVMGPNGQAQYWAPNLSAAVALLYQHYDYAYLAPGERWARPVETSDPRDRDVRTFPHSHPSSEFTTVGDVFSSVANPDRKKPFDIRTVMRAVTDQDHAVLERWAGMADADTTVVLDAHLGGHPVTVLGIESRPIQRRGSFPTDGPDQWTAGTLFPRSSKKAARAINAASGNRPLVVLANLSGFDGSPESLRNVQLEYGAEIGRAIVNFDGPIVFCVISRYHGGAFVVFSGTLNDNMEVLAVEGSYASVLGGAPAAAVVFTGEVDKRTASDPRVKELEAALSAADGVEAAHLRVELAALRSNVRSEKLGEVAAQFEGIHNIERARDVGSVHAIIPAAELRPRLIDAVERGMARAVGS